MWLWLWGLWGLPLARVQDEPQGCFRPLCMSLRPLKPAKINKMVCRFMFNAEAEPACLAHLLCGGQWVKAVVALWRIECCLTRGPTNQGHATHCHTVRADHTCVAVMAAAVEPTWWYQKDTIYVVLRIFRVRGWSLLAAAGTAVGSSRQGEGLC